MKSLKKIISNVQKAIELHQIAQVRLIFLDMTDRQLKDIGISRELLKKGSRAYPWHAEDESADVLLRLNPESADVVAFPQKWEPQEPEGPAPKLAA